MHLNAAAGPPSPSPSPDMSCHVEFVTMPSTDRRKVLDGEMRGRFVLYQHLTVRSVRRTGSQVHVVIADPNGTPRDIEWSFDDDDVARQRTQVIEGWRESST